MRPTYLSLKIGLFCTGLLLIGLHPIDAYSQALNNLQLLTDLAQAINAAAESIGKIGDSFAHLAVLGTAGYDAVKAREVRSELLHISAQTGDVIETQRVTVYASLQRYIDCAGGADCGMRWVQFCDGTGELLPKVQALLNEVRSQRNDFVATDAYEELLQALQGRISLLTSLKEMPPPTTPKELHQLKIVLANYKKLIEALVKTRRALDTYIEKTTAAK